MKAINKIKREILLLASQAPEFEFARQPLDTDEMVRSAYDKLVESDAHCDFENDFRQGQVETDIPSDWSRHYESKSVAAKMSDGSWVGWTYWYGGGKHGNPEEIDWMSEAYHLSCHEETKMVTVRTFKKVDEIS